MKTTRRNFLIGGSAIAAAAIPTAIPAVTAIENSELVAIGKALPETEAAYRAAQSEFAAALAVYESIKPQTPAALLPGYPSQDPHNFAAIAEWERDLEGEEISPRRKVLAAKELREETAEHSARSKLGKETRRRLVIAERFEAERAAALRASAAEELMYRRNAAARDLEALADKAGKIPAQTMHGIVIKSRAFEAQRAFSIGGYTRATVLYGPQLCSEIVSIMGRAV